MSVTLVNPYVSLEELKRELSIKATDAAADDSLLDAINAASRWVDHYTDRDFLFHDYSAAALVFDEFDDSVVADHLFLPYRPAISVTELRVGTEVWVEGTDFVVKPNWIISLRGDWDLRRGDARTLSILGTFGYRQPWVIGSAAVAAGGTGYTSGDVLTVVGGTGRAGTLEAALAGGPGPVTGFVVSGPGEYSANPTNPVALTGGTGTGATATLSMQVDSSKVPTGIPGHITLATRLVAAALSGKDRKEVAGLDGNKVDLFTNEIPKTVFQILGRQGPLLI